jgi:hypothetical protein
MLRGVPAVALRLSAPRAREEHWKKTARLMVTSTAPWRRSPLTLVALALAALRSVDRLGEVPALRVPPHDRCFVLGFRLAPNRPLLTALTGLREIYLYGLGLTRVPQALALAPAALTVLRLSNNRLTALPRWVGRFVGLRFLDLANNRFERVPLCLGDMTTLARLDLSLNRLAEMPDWFGRAMTSLRQLNLCMGFARGPVLSASFAGLANLRHLSLCCSPSLAPEFDSWDELGARDLLQPLWEPVYGLANLRGLVLHNTSVDSIDSRIASMRRLTRIDGLTLARGIPPEMGRIHGLVDMNTCLFVSPVMPHEFYVLGGRIPRRQRPMIEGTISPDDDNDPSRRPTVRSLPSLVDMCLTALCDPVAPTTCAPDVDQHPDRSLWAADGSDRGDEASSIDACDDSKAWDHTSPVLRINGGGPFRRDRDPGLFITAAADNNNNENSDGGDDPFGTPWYDDRGDSFDDSLSLGDPDNDKDESDPRPGDDGHPLSRSVRALLPDELVERACRLWSRSCASCGRPIIGPPFLVDTVRAPPGRFRLSGQAGDDPFLCVERAFCGLYCAPRAP